MPICLLVLFAFLSICFVCRGAIPASLLAKLNIVTKTDIELVKGGN